MSRVLIRVIGAPLLLAALAACLFVDFKLGCAWCITVVIAAFATVSYLELCSMARLKGLFPARILGVGIIILPYLLMTVFSSKEFTGPVVVSMGTVAILVLLVTKPRFTPPDAGFTIMAVSYVSLLLFIFSGEPANGSKRWISWLLFFVATNKGSDMAAYVVGKTMGRLKLAPRVSPNKTWEGAIAGFVVGTGLGHLILETLYPSSWTQHLGVAAAVTVAAQMGDLVKSAIKRWAGVKDSGRFLPEFGGALDMIDSFILSAPVAYLALVIFL